VTRPQDAAPIVRPPGWRPPAVRSQTSRKMAPPKTTAAGLLLAACEFCRAPIVWARELDNPNARTPEGKIGKLVPIDPEPSTDPRANLALSPPSGTHPQHRVGEMRPAQAAGYRAAGKDTYIRHVKTCTHADDLRRGVAARHGRRGR
jgi:hypothetical protein